MITLKAGWIILKDLPEKPCGTKLKELNKVPKKVLRKYLLYREISDEVGTTEDSIVMQVGTLCSLTRCAFGEVYREVVDSEDSRPSLLDRQQYGDKLGSRSVR
jgi:hypothetical protein